MGQDGQYVTSSGLPNNGSYATKISTKQDRTNQTVVKPTLKRYIILLLFCLQTGNKSFQWIQVPASTTKATIYFGVENYVINFSSIIFMISFVVISWPACYLIQRIGVRKAVLLASFGTILGSAIKCFSCSSNQVALLLLGQFVIALSQQLVHQIPPRIASLWFPDNQVSLCVAMCIFGNQFGIAVGFMVPQWLLKDAHMHDEIGAQFLKLFLITLTYSAILFVFTWFFFDEAPLNPPGLARQRQIIVEDESKATDESNGSIKHLLRQIWNLLGNLDLVLVAICFGMSLGRSDTIYTLLDQVINPLYPEDPTLVGNIGSLIIVTGAVGAPIWGRILDKTHAYKRINLIIAVTTTLSLILFAYLLIYVKLVWTIYASACLFGLFQSGFFVSAMEFGIELTYPAPEMITSSILFIMPAAFGPVFIIIGSYLVDNFGALSTHIFYLTTAIGSILCIVFTRERLNRQEAIKMQEKYRTQLEMINSIQVTSK